jgi:hypothetical protein
MTRAVKFVEIMMISHHASSLQANLDAACYLLSQRLRLNRIPIKSSDKRLYFPHQSDLAGSIRIGMLIMNGKLRNELDSCTVFALRLNETAFALSFKLSKSQ